MQSRSRLVCFGIAVVALAGCASPNLYSTPRTTPEGKLSHTVAVEAYGGTYTYVDMNGDERTGTVFLPTLPTYQLRYGAADDIDIGLRVANMTSLAADVKFNPVRSEMFDLAIDPGVQWIHIGGDPVSFDTIYLSAPILLGVNLSEAVTLVASPGAMYAVVLGDITGKGDLLATHGAFARLGVGLNLRAGSSFAIHPEVTVMRAFTSAAPLIYSFGLGFNFGRLPKFGDDGEAPSAGPRGRRPASENAGEEWLRPSGSPGHVEEVPR